jgi:NAD(P)-dependent dehydrogenase (short-subunit alcohol dehydrogenase family)
LFGRLTGPSQNQPSAGTSVAIIAGAGSGVGFATVEALADDHALVGVDLIACPEGLTRIDRLQWVQGDIASQDTWDSALTAARGWDPSGPACLIACAADLAIAPFLKTTPEDWRRLFDVNVLGVIRGMRTVMPGMLERGAGAIAVVCSVNSLFVEEGTSAYSTSKAALLHAVRSAALEYARSSLRINAVCPGAIDTPLLQRHFDSLDDPVRARRAVERRTPTGKILRPDEIAEVLRFLVSDAASGLSGAAVVVDAGLTTAYDFDVTASEGPVSRGEVS